MAYNANIPQPTDQLSQSQSDILNNFQALQTFLDVNHVDFASPDQGKHMYVTFPVQPSSPPIVFNAGELGLYSFLNPTTSKNELYINKTDQATVVQVPMTASILSTNSNPSASSEGWTMLPSGIMLDWGTFSGFTGLNTVTISGPAFPTRILNVQVTSMGAGLSNTFTKLVGITGANTFQIYVSNAAQSGAAAGNFSYLAIGF